MIGRGVVPHVERGKVYRSEYTYQCAETPAYLRALKVVFAKAARREDGLKIARELEALRLVRRTRPTIRTRHQLFLATAWQPFKIVAGAGQARYIKGALEAWAEA